MADDPQLGMARRMGKDVASSQGGTYLNQSPDSAGGSGGKVGDSVSSPHSSHDDKMHQQGGAGRSVKSIGSN